MRTQYMLKGKESYVFGTRRVDLLLKACIILLIIILNIGIMSAQQLNTAQQSLFTTSLSLSPSANVQPFNQLAAKEYKADGQDCITDSRLRMYTIYLVRFFPGISPVQSRISCMSAEVPTYLGSEAGQNNKPAKGKAFNMLPPKKEMGSPASRSIPNKF